MYRNNKLVKILVLIIIATFFTSLVAYASQSDSEEDTLTTVKKNGYETITVEQKDYIETYSANNLSWVYLREGKLTIPEETGTFLKYMVKDDQKVKKGDQLVAYQIPGDGIELKEKQLLLKRTQSDFEKQSKQMETSIADQKKKINKLDAKSLDAQVLELNLKKMQSEYEQYCYQTEKSLKEIQSLIENIKENLDTRYICAPYDGVVMIDDSLEQGMKLAHDTELVDIHDTDSAVLSINATVNNRLRYDTKVTVINSSNKDEEYQGQVVAADSVLANKAVTGVYYIRVEKPGLDSVFKKGNLSAIAVEVKDVIVIPTSVVVNEEGSSYVNILDENGEIRKQYITGRDNNKEMWVYNGLTEGQSIVVE